MITFHGPLSARLSKLSQQGKTCGELRTSQRSTHTTRGTVLTQALECSGSAKGRESNFHSLQTSEVTHG